MAKLRITYNKSTIGYSEDQKATIKSLGLRKLNSSVVHENTPSIRGMAFKVRHLVSVEEVDEATVTTKKAALAKLALSQGSSTLVNAPINHVNIRSSAADDLERIEGIGPKIADVLNTAGITTFAQLAATSVDQISSMLTDAHLRQLANPGTWPEQARLAAAGEINELEALQDSLKGGRVAS